MIENPEKWQLSLWTGRPSYISGYPGRVYTREYASRGAVNRALAPAWRSHRGSTIAEIAHFTFDGLLFWMGDYEGSEYLYRCPNGDTWLKWIDDQWRCPRCGDEWADEIIRPWTKESTP
jgi:hypothetical protein